MRNIWIPLCMLLLAGCSKSDIEEVNTSIGAENPTFYASLEGGDETRTYLDENLKMRWHNDDRITVFCGNDNNAEYAFTGKTGATAGDFQLIVENQTGTGEPVYFNYALYPHSSATKFVSTGPYGYLEYTIPATQHYVEGTFAPNTNLMAAVTETPEERRLQFKNVCGYLKLDLYGDDVTVKEITLRDNYGGPLAGAVRVEFAYRRDPMLTWEGTVMSDALTLDCGEGVKIGTTKETATSFYLVVPPTEFPGGFSVTITDTKGGTMIQTTEKAQEIKRNTVKSMAPFKVETIVWEELYAAERNALIEFYKALDGDNWTNNENWCSDKPVGEWYGIGVAENGSVSNISLSENNLSGVLPEEIGDLTRLKTLNLDYNHIAGSIPFSLCELENLEYLHLEYNSLTGSIPDKLADLFIRSSSKYWAIDLSSNRLSGVIPKGVAQSEYFRYMFGQIMVGNDLVLDTKIKAPVFSTIDIHGNLINDDIYSENKLTLLIHGAQSYVEPMIELYQEYHPKGLEIISYDYSSYIGSENELRQWYNDKNIPWRCFYSKNAFGSMNEHSYYPALIFGGAITLVDQNGIVLGSSYIKGYESCLNIIKKELQNDNSTYFSTDYSLDRVVTVLQQAKEGNGIEVVLMGDGYSDRQVADGTYLTDMKLIYKYLFNIEPYSSFKDLFTVKVLNVISLTEGYDTGYTPALETRILPESASVGFHDMSNVGSAAESVLTDPNKGTTIVLANSTVYAGTCFLGRNIYYPMDIDGDGISICCITKPDEAILEQLIHHEACGHGFAKLADEYAYEGMGAVPSDYVSEIQSQQANWGWWKNVDFTSDPTATRWSHFVNDTRYANDGLGAYEGGLTYWTGVWRPTENSIMRYNTGGFNAPSREAIYYRIHKLAYGAEWQYDYEKFVEWDARNRAAAATRAMIYKPTHYQPTPPPVVINRSWRDAK